MPNTWPWPLTSRRPPAESNLTEEERFPTTGLTALQGVDDFLQVRRGEAVGDLTVPRAA